MKNNIKITWDELHNDLYRLAKILEPFKVTVKNIYGIPRGGLIIAVILSHILSLPMITDKRMITRNTLVVDDIADTGATLKKLLKVKKPGLIATLWFHPQSKVIPEVYLNLKKDSWVIFPWETIKSSKYDGTEI